MEEGPDYDEMAAMEEMEREMSAAQDQVLDLGMGIANEPGDTTVIRSVQKEMAEDEDGFDGLYD